MKVHYGKVWGMVLGSKYVDCLGILLEE